MKNRKNKIYSFLILFVVFSISIFINPADASAECSIQSATFTPSGNQSDNWFKDDAAPSVQLKVTGNSECAGKTAEVSIVEDDTVGVDDDVAGIDDLNVIFPVSNTFTINLKAGETDCEQWTGNDCEYYIKIDLTDADNFSGGKLEYDCDGLCNTDWVVGKIDRPGGDASKETAPTCKEGEEIKDGKCVPIDPNYYLLAPLPCQAGSSEGCIQNPDGSYTLQKFDPRGEGGGNLGKYLNIMIRIFIGICAVLAVMMIVVGGIEYMTSELMSTKEQGRHKISGAIFGLLLALGAWTLLNQINPDLLNTELNSLTDQVVTVELMDDTETLTEAYTQSPLPTTAVAGCPGKMVKTKNGIVVCDNILSNLETMIAAAQKENLSLTGYGYRHAENQRQKRIKNCNGDTTNRSAKCTPPTALPGFSRHNAGLAVDFRCNSQPINTRDNACFKWLQTNASKYRFYNLPSEPWHWSIDGR